MKKLLIVILFILCLYVLNLVKVNSRHENFQSECMDMSWANCTKYKGLCNSSLSYVKTFMSSYCKLTCNKCPQIIPKAAHTTKLLKTGHECNGGRELNLGAQKDLASCRDECVKQKGKDCKYLIFGDNAKPGSRGYKNCWWEESCRDNKFIINKTYNAYSVTPMHAFTKIGTGLCKIGTGGVSRSFFPNYIPFHNMTNNDCKNKCNSYPGCDGYSNDTRGLATPASGSGRPTTSCILFGQRLKVDTTWWRKGTAPLGRYVHDPITHSFTSSEKYKHFVCFKKEKDKSTTSPG